MLDESVLSTLAWFSRGAATFAEFLFSSWRTVSAGRFRWVRPDLDISGSSKRRLEAFVRHFKGKNSERKPKDLPSTANNAIHRRKLPFLCCDFRRRAQKGVSVEDVRSDNLSFSTHFNNKPDGSVHASCSSKWRV